MPFSETRPAGVAAEEGTTVSTTVSTTESTAKNEPRKCGDLKHGQINLRCVLLPGHAAGPDATWHAATCTENRVVEYDGARHEIHMRETVTWEPVDHVAEAVRHLTAGREDAR